MGEYPLVKYVLAPIKPLLLGNVLSKIEELERYSHKTDKTTWDYERRIGKRFGDYETAVKSEARWDGLVGAGTDLLLGLAEIGGLGFYILTKSQDALFMAYCGAIAREFVYGVAHATILLEQYATHTVQKNISDLEARLEQSI